MDLRKYTELKSKGFVSVISDGTSHAVVSRKFDPDSGEEVAAETVPFNPDKLLEQKALHEKSIAAIDAILAELQ